MNYFVKMLSTLFFIGYSKKFPGTLASLFSSIIIWFFYSGTIENFGIFLLICLLSIWICGRAEKIFGNKDDQRIVLDEFVGTFVSLIFVPKSILLYLLAFILFRVFDIKKPWFIKKSQELKGGLGIVIDDVLAGGFTSILLVIVVVILSR